MNRKSWKLDQIRKTFKISESVSYFDCSNRLHSLVGMMESDGDDHLLDNEAVDVAKKMSGTYDWKGMLNEYKTFSGLKSRINKNMISGWSVTELAHGDGFSTYYLG